MLLVDLPPFIVSYSLHIHEDYFSLSVKSFHNNSIFVVAKLINIVATRLIRKLTNAL